ncbi:MAG TPA: hypothetical protein VN822_07060 [Candidatus Acidoferrales bacterium]|nr:hypothetical protein [Candidatus Acidoferrales bacterium]
MKRAGSILILCLSSLCLSACAFRNAGPCYGIGCPAFAPSKSAQDQSGNTSQHAQSRKFWHRKAKNASAAQPPAKQGD